MGLKASSDASMHIHVHSISSYIVAAYIIISLTSLFYAYIKQAPCPEIYILDATYLQLPEGTASLPPLNTPLHAMVHGHPFYDTRYGYMHHGHGHSTL